MMAQSGIWYAQSLEPASTFYSISDCLDIRGPIDPALMRAAHQRVVAETEALRLRFTQTEQGPAQYIDPSIGSALDYHDVSSEQRPAAAAVACMRAVMAEVPDLLKGTGLYSATLFRLAPDRFMLFQHVHHILLDGWSLILLHNRIAAVYTALASGQSVERDSFPPLRLLLENEAAYRSSTRMDRDRQYWASYLKDAEEPVRLSGRHAAATGDVWHRSADLGEDLVRALLSRANDLGVSWRSMAIAVAAAYVGRMTGATEVTLGLPVLGRLSRAERDVPGMTTNGLPLRLSTAPGTNLADFTKHTESAMRAVLLHSRYRSEDLARDFGLLSTGRVLWGPVVNVMAFDYDLRFAGAPAVLRTLSHPKVNDIAVTFYQTSADGALELIIDANATAYQQAEIDAHLSPAAPLPGRGGPRCPGHAPRQDSLGRSGGTAAATALGHRTRGRCSRYRRPCAAGGLGFQNAGRDRGRYRNIDAELPGPEQPGRSASPVPDIPRHRARRRRRFRPSPVAGPAAGGIRHPQVRGSIHGD